MTIPFPNARLSRKGVIAQARTIAFEFDGRELLGLQGETVAAALTAAGISAMRDAGNGEKRGLFCGMGACYDCVVTIDGRAGQRACMQKLNGGEVICSASPKGTKDDPLRALTLPPVDKAMPERGCDVLVIGAGPAGLNAALAAARAGCGVIVLDERAQPGGQFYKPLATTHEAGIQPDDQFARGKALTDEVRKAGVELIGDAQVWGAFAADEIMALVDGGAVLFRPRRLVLATGAFERPVPVPGWTLPGVMTAGAMQTLARAYQIKPGRRVLIAGNGPLNFQLAADLAEHGVEVVALAEAALKPDLGKSSDFIAALISGPGNMAMGARYIFELKRRNVPVLWGQRVEEIREKDGALEVRVSGSSDVFEADAVALGYGFEASSEIANALGCRVLFDGNGLSRRKVETDKDGRTSLEAVFAVGDGARIGGAALAESLGWNAGLCVAADLGWREAGLRSKPTKRHENFQRALWRLFEAPVFSPEQIAGNTMLCRCESITFETVRSEIAGGARSLGVLKRRLRLGMGRCQGRYCSMIAADLLKQVHGDIVEGFAPRMPVKPFPASSLAFEKPEWGGHKRAGSPNLARSVAIEPFGEIETDFAIIGGGVVGACLAYEFAERGQDVVLLERDDANLQASGANAGSLHVQLLSFDFGDKAEAGGGPAADTLPLAPWAIGLWQELAAACGDQFEIRITGGLMVAESEAGMRFLEAKAALERKHGLQAEILTRKELLDKAPNLSDRLIGAEWSPIEGKINPLAATYAVLDQACALGLRFERSTDVTGLERAGRAWEIHTSRGKVRAGRIINAAGPWARQIGAMAGLDIPVYSAPLQMIVTEKAPELVDQLIAHADRHLSLKQLASGGLVIGGAWTARYSPEQNLNVTMRHSVEGNLWVAMQVLPQLAGLQVIRSWAGMNVNIDGAPIIGEAHGKPGFFNCITSNGYTLAPAVARLTADMALGQEPGMNVKPYLLDRF